MIILIPEHCLSVYFFDLLSLILCDRGGNKTCVQSTRCFRPIAFAYNAVSFDQPGLPRSEKNIWKMKKVGEFYGWPGKFRKDLESQGKGQGI